ncbi:phosphonate C-P lyase system protein PhnG [Nodosilinea sp. LEGE 07088]|uniref:phosphonate C-P lyase system protein PhnG n=1 Tax=Nodosilinea sp. LEGE 07088 TaxID=2777968 RepID=UPI00188195C8|nr:phosphonate C-P lyase system protein PhnG [Nodosilinea sp. LEGE 07088]MBE9139936.1 phosphonate C-P lyase system protein PhnG [Nodosilinea sp. LEGE 07088]
MSELTPRQQWMAVLAKAPLADLEAQVAACGDLPAYRFLRSPQTGLAMVRGRAGGTGEPFNLGEITLTRCVVQLEIPGDRPDLGFGYVAGRCHRHAELAALCDALIQHPQWRDSVHTQVVEPLGALAHTRQTETAQQTAATRVNFFTLRRGES